MTVPLRDELPGLSRLARPCPRCGGPVFRSLSAWRQVLYLLPVHLGGRTAHRCMRCQAEYVSGSTPSDVLLTVGFVGAHCLLGSRWWIGLVFLVVWLLFTAYFHRIGRGGPIHVFIAAILVATLWFVGLANVGVIPADLLRRQGGRIYGVAGMLAFLCGYAMLWLDKHAAPALRPRQSESEETPGLR